MSEQEERLFDVSVLANGDPERFRARKVEITSTLSGCKRTFVIEPGQWGGLFVHVPGVALPYHLGSTRVERDLIKVNVYVTAADEALAREEREDAP